ncbi:hypothetical protein N183_31885 [Sinorhizobium sp. Sb3]|nr:hypothetical protein N183_31885 [Sinorhizobium sp. Sb3]
MHLRLSVTSESVAVGSFNDIWSVASIACSIRSAWRGFSIDFPTCLEIGFLRLSPVT